MTAETAPETKIAPIFGPYGDPDRYFSIYLSTDHLILNEIRVDNPDCKRWHKIEIVRTSAFGRLVRLDGWAVDSETESRLVNLVAEVIR